MLESHCIIAVYAVHLFNGADMWKQIERSTPPRPLKRKIDRPPAPPKGPKITSARKEKRKHGIFQRVPMKLVAGLTAGVFGIGLAVGIGIGIVVVEPERPATDVALPEKNDWEADQITDEGEYSIPVSVYRSERALRNFVYEESPPPDLPEQIMGAVPDVGLVEEPDNGVVGDVDVVVETEKEPLLYAEPQDPIPLFGAIDPGPEQVGETKEPEQTVASLPEPPSQPLTETLDRIPAVPLWRQNAVPVSIDFTRPMIAIVIDDVGINQPRSQRAIALPGRLTIAFIPYGYNLPSLVGTARENGHEVLVHLPTEPMSPDVDPGPNALLTSLSLAEIKRRIDWNLSQFDGYVGLNNHMGSKFTAWTPGMELLIRETKARGMLFLDSITTQDSVGFRLARAVGVPNAIRDVFLDHDQRPEAIARQLRRTEGVAQSRGYAIAIGHPHDETLDELDIWLETVESRGFQLVPISAIVRRNYPQG